jgi:hypothetical protein
MKRLNIYTGFLFYLLTSATIINAQWSDEPANPKEVKLTGGSGFQTISDCQGGMIGIYSNLVEI